MGNRSFYDTFHLLLNLQLLHFKVKAVFYWFGLHYSGVLGTRETNLKKE